MNNKLNVMVHHRNTYDHNYDLIKASLIKKEKKFVTVMGYRKCSDS